MRDGAGKVVGIRLRAADGRKWSVKGGHEGLFYSPALEVKDTLYVCEGPTDTAAALSMGVPAVGRPSCLGAVEHLKALVVRLRVRSLTIIADHDRPRELPDGRIAHPGLDGTRKLIAELRRMARIVVPPAKDMREWFAAGALELNRAAFDGLVAAAQWRMG
jgi:hypothetical protein